MKLLSIPVGVSDFEEIRRNGYYYVDKSGSEKSLTEKQLQAVDWKEGTSVTFNEDMDIKTIDSEVTPVVEEVTGDKNVQPTKVVGTNQVVIKTRTLSQAEREKLDQALVDKFDVDESLIATESISSTVSSEMRRDAVVAVIVATLCMLVYIWFRFKDIRFASSAVLALLHDVLVVLAFYSPFICVYKTHKNIFC